MRDRKGIVLCILIGSFCVYCGQSVMTEMSHTTGSSSSSGGTTAVGNAMGDTACCTPPGRETLTVLFDDLVSPAPIAGMPGECTMTTPTLQVSDLRTIVIHSPQCGFLTQVRNGKAGFVQGPVSPCDVSGGGTLGHALTVDTLLGHEMRVNFSNTSNLTAADPDGVVSCSQKPIPVTIVGYKNP